ncbi:MAG: ASKHA domain-containing protein [Desulfobacterales bacterium]
MENTVQGWIKTISLAPPTLQNNTADADRLLSALKMHLATDQIELSLSLLRKLPDQIRKWKYMIRCILFKDRKRWILAGITDPDDSSPVTGLAVDLGTTRVVIRLLDLVTGKSLGESSFDNPQIGIGPDILTRIHFSDQNQGLDKLNQMITGALNTKITSLCRSCNTETQHIFLMAVAGNTAMTHLLLGLKPHFIIREPYIPVSNTPGVIRASELGLEVNPDARVLVFPNVGSYFGGDLIAGILFSGLHRKEETSILVDVGTNAEVVLGNSNWLVCCAGAAGPALEGGVTKMGMMAGKGVIDKIAIDPSTGQFTVHTIENNPPIGICGSGLIDLAAQLFLSGMIDIRGKLMVSETGPRIREIDGILHVTIVPAEKSATGSDLTISQTDLDSLSRSKAAMYTILETITETVGIRLAELSTFYVAGTFGSFINPSSAISIGMLPDLPLDSYIVLGNSSLEGAAISLTDRSRMDEITEIRDRITYMELNVNQEFMNRFSAAKFFPHTDPSLFPSVQYPNRAKSF